MHTQYGPGDPQTWGAIRSPADPRYDEDSEVAREEAIQAAASLIWDREIGVPGCEEHIRPSALRDGLDAIAATADDTEIAELQKLMTENLPRFGWAMELKLNEYLWAYCVEKARAQIDQQEREAEIDAAIARMGY